MQLSCLLIITSSHLKITLHLLPLHLCILIFYLFLGFVADTFIGRYRMIQFSLWVQFLTVTMSTMMAALLYEYHFRDWQLILFFSMLDVLEMLAHSSFHVVAIQFGMDQLQGAPSQLLSAFIFWYYMVEFIPDVIFTWVFYIFSLKQANVHLCVCLFNAVLISAVLTANNWCMSKWFVREKTTSRLNFSRARRNQARRSDNSNPLCLIYRILKYTKEHRSPEQRSALTYWENKPPSRIDLGKRKYGGPFTTEEVEDVKTFLQLCLLLISLSGILVAWNMFCVTDSESKFDNSNNSHLREMIDALSYTVIVGLLILCRLLCCFNKCHLSMLRRIGIGAALTIVYMLSIIAVNSQTIKSVYIASFVVSFHILSNILYYVSYIVLTVSLIEFIIAQSPHAMKGILIGIYYVMRFGVGGIFDLIQALICSHVHTTRLSIRCCMLANIVMTIIAVLSFIVYCVVACKYKLRERDEVVNVHIFAEEYYGTREKDSDTSDVDQDK